MTDSVENRVLEHLRHIHGRVDQLADDVAQLKHRMTSLEGTMVLVAGNRLWR
jgi:predicted small metal-binding protein